MLRLFYIVLFLCRVYALNNYVHRYAHVIHSLHQHHFTKAVVILWSSKYKGILLEMVAMLQKALSQKGVMTTNVLTDTILFSSMVYKEKLLYCIPIIKEMKWSNMMIEQLNFKNENIWLMLVQDGIFIEQLIQDVYVPFDTEFIVAQWKENTVKITEIYREARNESLLTYTYGIWSDYRLITWPNRQIYKRRYAFHSLTLKAAALSGFPIIYTKIVNGRREITGGTIKPVVEVLKNHLNFRLDLFEPEDKKWGAYENGSWNGVIGMLASEKVDLILNIIAVSKKNLDIMDFVTPILMGRILLYMRMPSASGMTWKSYVQPFSFELWICTISIIFIIATLIAILQSRNISTNSEPLFTSFTNALICVIGSFCSQGIYKRYPPNTIRIAILSNFIVSLILVSSYSAFIISYLTIRKIEMPFTNFPGILRDGSYKMGVLAHSSAILMFQFTNDSIRLQVYKKLIAPIEDSLPRTTMEGLRRACRDKKFMYLTSEIIAKACFDSVPCQVVNVPDVRYNTHFTLPTVKNSPYTGIFSYTVLKLIEGGILKRLFTDFKDTYKEEAGLTTRSIKLDSTAAVFILLCIGAATSLVLLILEILYFKVYKLPYVRSNKYYTELKETEKITIF